MAHRSERDRIAWNVGIEDDRGPPGPVFGMILEEHGPVACTGKRESQPAYRNLA